MSLAAAGDELRALVEEAAQEHHCPTVSWAVVHDHEVMLAGSHGVLHSGRAPTPDTVYRIASMTKSFTAATVLALRDEQRLSLDDHIADLAPELANVVGPTRDAAAITVRHLLSMASGLATDDAWADRHLDITSADLLHRLRAGTLFAQPTGTAFEYSNLGYAILGHLVRTVTGTSVQSHVSDRFLGPLGMDHTTWTCPPHDDWAGPHFVVDDDAHPDPLAPLGDGELAAMGGLWSTAADLCRWMSWLDEASPAGDEPDDGPLRRSSRREMQQVQRYDGMKVLAGRAAPTGYGFGLMIRDDDLLGHVAGHSGGLPGYGSNMRWICGGRVGVVALANVTYAPMSTLTLRILEVLQRHGALPTPPAPRGATTAAIDLAGRRLAALLADWHDDVAGAVFADNVDLDEPYQRRAAAAREVCDRLGPFEIESVTASSSAAGEVVLVGRDRLRARVPFHLTPLMPPLVQWYEVEIIEPVGE